MQAAGPSVVSAPSRACSGSGGQLRTKRRRRFSVFPFFCVPDFPSKRFSPLTLCFGARSLCLCSLRGCRRPSRPGVRRRFLRCLQAGKTDTDSPSSADILDGKDTPAWAGNPSPEECPPSRHGAAAEDNTAEPDGTAAAPAGDTASPKAAKSAEPAPWETARDPPPDTERNGCRRPGRTSRPAKRASRHRDRGKLRRHGRKAAPRFPIPPNRRSRSPASPRPIPARRSLPRAASRETYPVRSRKARPPVPFAPLPESETGPADPQARPTERAAPSAPPTLPPAGWAPP